MSNQKYTTEFKKQVVEFYLDHHTTKETLQEFHVPESTMFAWKQQYQRGVLERPRHSSGGSVKHMQRKLDRMKAVLEAQSILKCSPTASNAEKAKAVDSLKGRYSVRVLCDAVSLPTGTYYNRKHREQAPTQHELDEEQLKKLIKDIFNQSEYRLGKKPIKHKLSERGINVAEERISRLMKEMGLTVQRPTELGHYKKPLPRKYFKNRLNNQYSQIAPNSVWVSDITYVRVGDEYKFVCVVMDLFSRRVLSYAVSEHIDTMLTIKTFSEAYRTRGNPENLLFHSDQGVQYTCDAFLSFLRENKVRQSFSTPGTPTENAVCESFFARMKFEALYRYTYLTTDELELEVGKYVDYYNNRRPHRFLNFKTPAEFESAYYENLKA